MNHQNGTERQREIERHRSETAADAERMLENTRRFLENLSDSAPESRRYVSALKNNLEKQLRHLKARTAENPEAPE